MYFIKLKPAGKDYLWGGTKLKTDYGKNIDLEPLAETWEFSTHLDGLSVVDNGEFKGETLLDFFKQNPNLFGDKFKELSDLPILVKFIDAKNKLSVQVHPDDDYALKNEKQNGKTEMWYVLEAEKGAKIVYGFEHDVTAEMIKQSLTDGSIEKHLHFENVKKGDVFFIPAGMIHGIGEGVVVAEIQENSNLTYRVYDYNRVDKNGNKRELHVDKALQVLKMKSFNGRIYQNKTITSTPSVLYENLCECQYFNVKRYVVRGTLEICVKNDSFNVLLCIGGNGIIKGKDSLLEIKKGECVLIPNGYDEINICGSLEFLKINC